MKVKDVIISSLNILGRTELANLISSDGQPDAEGQETINILLYCFNSVEDEVARCYIPLRYKEELQTTGGVYYYKSFSRTPVKIKKVTSGGAAVQYELYTEYLKTDAKTIEVEYEYSPSKKTIDGESDLSGEVGEYTLALGAAAEYCLINGEAEEYGLWESRYRSAIDAVQRKIPLCGYIPPRRWV